MKMKNNPQTNALQKKVNYIGIGRVLEVARIFGMQNYPAHATKGEKRQIRKLGESF